MKASTKMIEKRNIFDVLIVGFLIFLTLITLYPFIFVLAGSFSNGIEYGYGGVWLYPVMPTIANYLVVFSDNLFFESLFRTLLVTVIGVVSALLFTSLVAYAMSQSDLKFRNFFWNFFLVTMFFSGGMIPSYILMRTLGLYDTFYVYIIPSLFSVYNCIIISNFFKGIDPAMRESAYIDGAGEFTIWALIYIPLSTPVLSTVALWLAVGKWNGFMGTLLYTDTTKHDLWLLQFYMMRLIKFADTPDVDMKYVNEVSGKTIQYASIVVSILPMVIMYPFFARFLSKGIMIGSLKG